MDLPAEETKQSMEGGMEESSMEGGGHQTANSGTNTVAPSLAETTSGAGNPKPTIANSPTARGPRPCGVCHTEAAKYKCPRCPISYCSVACNRIHKENHPPPEESNAQKVSPTTRTKQEQERQEDDPYKNLLEHRSEFERLFRKYPDLEAELMRIHQTTLPPKDDGNDKNGLPWKLQIPEQSGKKHEVWSRSVGLRKGAAALRKARTNPGDVGDGVREYCDLVLYLLSRPGGPDPANVLRQEVAADETKVIEQLMAKEKDWP